MGVDIKFKIWRKAMRNLLFTGFLSVFFIVSSYGHVTLGQTQDDLCKMQVEEGLKMLSFSYKGKVCILIIQKLDKVRAELSNDGRPKFFSFNFSENKKRVSLMLPNGNLREGDVFPCYSKERGWYIRWDEGRDVGAMDGCKN
jgi:hypothetical protein